MSFHLLQIAITCLSAELLQQLVILIAIKFAAYLTGKYSHEPVADLLNRWEYGVDLICETLSVAKISHYSTVFFLV